MHILTFSNKNSTYVYMIPNKSTYILLHSHISYCAYIFRQTHLSLSLSHLCSRSHQVFLWLIYGFQDLVICYKYFILKLFSNQKQKFVGLSRFTILAVYIKKFRCYSIICFCFPSAIFIFQGFNSFSLFSSGLEMVRFQLSIRD